MTGEPRIAIIDRDDRPHRAPPRRRSRSTRACSAASRRCPTCERGLGENEALDRSRHRVHGCDRRRRTHSPLASTLFLEGRVLRRPRMREARDRSVHDRLQRASHPCPDRNVREGSKRLLRGRGIGPGWGPRQFVYLGTPPRLDASRGRDDDRRGGLHGASSRFGHEARSRWEDLRLDASATDDSSSRRTAPRPPSELRET